MADEATNKIVGSRAREGARELAEYWTPERLKSAVPVPTPGPGRGEEEVKIPEAERVAPGVHAPRLPEGEEKAERAGGAFPVPNPKQYPFITCGKLFFTQGGNNYVGSAAVVDDHVVLTAGHCVHQGGGGGCSSNVMFYPAYPVLGKSYGYHFLGAWTAWTNNGNRAYDYGMIWLTPAIGNEVGHLGILWNASTSGRSWRAVGYPVAPNPPFNGNAMDETLGTYVASGINHVIGINNDNMKGGSSGGSWISDYNGAAVYANGLQSFHTTDPNVEFGPYFTDEVKKLLDWVNDPNNHH